MRAACLQVFVNFSAVSQALIPGDWRNCCRIARLVKNSFDARNLDYFWKSNKPLSFILQIYYLFDDKFLKILLPVYSIEENEI